jgi:hypothetical protein
MASDRGHTGIFFLAAAVVGIGTATYLIIRKRRLEPTRAIDRMLDYCSTKAEEIERLLGDGAQRTPATT